MIRHHSFKHGWFYHYRVHTRKLSQFSELFPALEEYLLSLFESCPDEHFTTGPRGSSLTVPIDADVAHVPGHAVCSAARFGLENGRYKTAHSNVQVTMLENDEKTLAVEVPLWMTPDDYAAHEELFSSDEPLSGHIDLLAVEDDRLWVWDFKPGAASEKHAHVQTYFYALMLSKRTGISLSDMRCGYFDEEDCYVFEPEEVALPVTAR